MRVLVSGQAALSVTLDQPFQVRALDEAPRPIGEPNAATGWLFQGCTDVSEHDVDTLEQADALTEAAWASDRALRIFLMLLDPAEPEDELPEYVVVLDELLSNEVASRFTRERLATHPLPGLFDFNRVDAAAAAHERVQELLNFVIQRQGFIQRARDVFYSVSVALFSSEDAKRSLYQRLSSDGSVHSVVKALSEGADLTFLKLSITSKNRDLRDIIAEWIGRLQPGAGKRISRDALLDTDASVDGDDEDQAGSVYASHEIFSQVRAQQFAITEKLKTRDIAGAKRLIDGLIKLQRANSSNEQISKTLSYLAQQAKLQSVPELHLEWAKWAARENPADPVTFGHLADALIVTGHFPEAEEALVAAETLGRHLYARTGRARILRLTGKYAEARERYLAAAADHIDHPEVPYALSGAADCLKDMGRHKEAIKEFTSLTEKFPFNVFVWNGLARALLDAGHIGEALVSYSKSDANGRNAVASVGRAIAFSRTGRFNEAMAEFDNIILAYPNNRAALCGRAEALKLSGKTEDAVRAYEYAISRCPYDAAPIRDLAYLYLENGNPRKSLEIFNQALAKFAYDRASIIGRVNSLMAGGEFTSALNAIDVAIGLMPTVLDLPLVRAKLLSQMGNEAEAVSICDGLITRQPENRAAVLLKSKILYKSGQAAMANQLLSQSRPVVVSDWIEFALKCIISSDIRGSGFAKRELEKGLSMCPFFRGRKYLRSAFISVSLAEGRNREALQILEARPSEVSNLIALHAYVVNNRIGNANLCLTEIRSSGIANNIVSFADAAIKRGITLRSTRGNVADQLLRSGREQLFDAA